MKIEFSLSTSSIENAIAQIKAYQESLKEKNSIFLERLAKIGVEVIRETMMEVPEEQRFSEAWDAFSEKTAENAIAIKLMGDKVMFIEFSAGITYGTDSYPLPSGAPYGMGTYNPKSDKWKDPDGWWYHDGNEFHHTYGNRAYMPVYHASEAIKQAIVETAREVFGT